MSHLSIIMKVKLITSYHSYISIKFYFILKWFPNSKGFASSAVLFGIGAGSIIFDEIQTQYINPNNYSPDKAYSNLTPNEK